MTNEDTQAKGDNDPVDVCEIGQHVGHSGEIKKVKVLGVMALLDEGETDWKLLAIDVNDPLANQINGKCAYIMQNVGLTFSLICDTCRYKRH
jgi:inorganic pyrophosphatase